MKKNVSLSSLFLVSVSLASLLSTNLAPTLHVDAFCPVASISTPASFRSGLQGLSNDANEQDKSSKKNGKSNGNSKKSNSGSGPNSEEIRKARLIQDSSSLSGDESNNKYASGEELAMLREDLTSLKQNLEWAKALKDEARIESLEKAIGQGQNRDPFYMYDKAQKIIAEAKKMEDVSDEEKKVLIDKWTTVEADAREFLPHLNMEGLWVGDYGENKGLQLINITYTGDELIATKVTGDINVPRGEQSFTVNVKPCNASALPPVKLVSDQRSGEFYRFPGKGQVSRKGFKDNRFVEGQMVMFEDRFSFVWIPTKHHVLFHRPSPETTIKLLRNTISKEDELENMREHVSRCFDMDLSTAIARQQDPFLVHEPLRRISTQEELDEVAERIKKGERGNLFLQIGKWRNYIDQVLDSKNSN